MSGAIVCGVDLRNGGEAVARAADMLARELGGHAVLVHVMDPPSRPPERGLPSLRRARHLGRLRAIVEELGLRAGTIAEVLAGEPADQLVRGAEKRDAELIVLGSSGPLETASALRRGALSALMRTAPCPVIVVPPDAALPSRVSSIVCGVDGGSRDVPLLRLAADLARRTSATVGAVHAFSGAPTEPGDRVTPPVIAELRDAADGRVRRAIAKAAVDARPCVRAEPPAEALVRAAEEHDAGLIAVASQGQGTLGSMKLGSVSLRLAALAPVPVVMLPPRAELAAGSGHYELAAIAA